MALLTGGDGWRVTAWRCDCCPDYHNVWHYYFEGTPQRCCAFNSAHSECTVYRSSSAEEFNDFTLCRIYDTENLTVHGTQVDVRLVTASDF